MFKEFNDDLKAHFESMDGTLYLTDVDADLMWETYLAAFPKGTNELYRERTEHDCSCCRHFVKHFGNVVAIKGGELVSIWDIETIHPYNTVCKVMSKFVKTKIVDVFLHNEKHMGNELSLEQTENGVTRWNHFYCKTPNRVYTSKVATESGNLRTNKNVLARSMKELTIGAAESILEIIDQGALYRGEEFRGSIQQFITLKREYDGLTEDKRDIWCWSNCSSPFTRIRNTAIGTLLIDLSNDVDLDVAVRKFEVVMAPTNYKRPKAIITKKMVKAAEEKNQRAWIG